MLLFIPTILQPVLKAHGVTYVQCRLAMAAVERISFYGFGVAVMSFCAFVCCAKLAGLLSSLLNISLKVRWKWNNLLVSWIHSVIIGSFCIYALCVYPEMMRDLVDFYNVATYTIVATSAGYFVSDSVDIIAYGQTGTMRDVLIHHISVTCCLAYSIANCQFIGYSVVGLTVEVNSVFLHLRKLMQIMHFGFQHPLYRIVCLMNLISFVASRFAFSMIFVSHSLIAHRYRMSTFFLSILVPTVAIMWIVNIVLFWRLFTNDVLRHQPVRLTTNNDHMLKGAELVTAVVNNNQAAARRCKID